MAEVERHDDEQSSGSVWEYLTQKDADKTSAESFREQQEQERGGEKQEREESAFNQFTPDPPETEPEPEQNKSLFDKWWEAREDNPMNPGGMSRELQDQIAPLIGIPGSLPEKGIMDQLFAEALGNTVGFFAGGKDGEEKTSGQALDPALMQHILDIHHAPAQDIQPQPEPEPER